MRGAEGDVAISSLIWQNEYEILRGVYTELSECAQNDSLIERYI